MEYEQTLKGHVGSVLTVKFNTKGDYCKKQFIQKLQGLSGGTDKICRLWNPKKGKLIQEYKGHSYDIFDIQIVYDNSAFASCGGDKKTFIWDVSKAKNIRTFREHTSVTFDQIYL
jgi:mitogen-activated protein kinase organizer 1